MKKNYKYYLFMFFSFLVYSMNTVLSKKAASYSIGDIRFYILYFSAVLILGIYAVLWQQILKRIPLNVAYASKSITMLYGFLWGKIFFDEFISTREIVGAIIIIIGIILVVTKGEE